MNKTRLFSMAALLVAAGLSMLAPASAHAQSLELPRSYSHEGLIFAQGLTLASSSDSPLQPHTIHFQSHANLEVKKVTKPIVRAEAIITLMPKINTVAATSSKPTPTPTSFPTPTVTPTPVAGSSATPAVTPTPTAAPVATTHPVNTGSLDAEKLFTMANAHRASMGLPPFQKDERSCQLAAERAPEVAGEVASGNLHAGLAARNLPYWNTENIIQMRTEEEAFHWWINHDIHRRAIEGNFTYSCAACSGNNCAQQFTNFQPK